MVGMRIWDKKFGWGTIIGETERLYIIRFDADPWFAQPVEKGDDLL